MLFILYFIFWSAADISVSRKAPIYYEEIGYFDLESPWSSYGRPLPAPRSPEKVKLEFYLTNRKTIDKSIREWKVDTTYFYKPSLKSLQDLDYQKDRLLTVVHIHGMYQSIEGNWKLMVKMAKAYLSKVDVNIIFLQYDAKVWNVYPQLVADIRVVGAIAAKFLEQLIELTHLRVDQIHIIGFCMGAHVAGYIGKRLPNIYRITGLEPAKPFFENANPMYRLSDFDAHHVDVLHTNTNFWGFGCKSPLGDIDFYFNGASVQPGCEDVHRTVLKQFLRLDFKSALPKSYLLVACSHNRVTKYWIEALESRNCEIWGIEGTLRMNKNRFLSSQKISAIQNQKNHSVKKKCVPVGLNTFEYATSGNFHVTTNKNFPYCNPNNSCSAIHRGFQSP